MAIVFNNLSGGGSKLYQHVIRLGKSMGASFSFSLITSDNTPFKSIGEIAKWLYNNNITSSLQAIIGEGYYYQNYNKRYYCITANSETSISLNYKEMQFAGETISTTTGSDTFMSMNVVNDNVIEL